MTSDRGQAQTGAQQVPTKSYVLWYSPRSGSNLLCDAMRFTERAGDPHELLSSAKVLNLLPHYEVGTYADAQLALWNRGTKAGVFGMKCQIVNPELGWTNQALHQFPGATERMGLQALWSNAFPNCHHIAMTRRNKVRQAVSWYRATQTREWTREPGAPGPIKEVRDLYDKGKIQHFMLNAVMRDALMSEFFVAAGITPHVVVYEDFIADQVATVRGIFAFLGLDYKAAEYREPILSRQADDLSEQWVQQFREDQQVGWQRRW